MYKKNKLLTDCQIHFFFLAFGSSGGVLDLTETIHPQDFSAQQQS